MAEQNVPGKGDAGASQKESEVKTSVKKEVIPGQCCIAPPLKWARRRLGTPWPFTLPLLRSPLPRLCSSSVTSTVGKFHRQGTWQTRLRQQPGIMWWCRTSWRMTSSALPTR